MSAAGSRFLDPATLGRLRDLHLVARAVVEGFLAGRHLDARPGAGVEFSQYRAYQPGDDPRRIDWRLQARTDRFFIRQAEVEREVTVRFLLDASASMAHADETPTDETPAGRLSKLDYGRYLVASLAYLAELQGDRPRLHALGGGGGADEDAAGGSLRHLLARLERLEPAGSWPPWDEVAPRLERGRGRRRELVVVIGDLYQRAGEVEAALAALRALGHEVVVFHLVARGELSFDYRGDLLFEDLETGETVRADAEAIRAGYLERLEAGLEEVRRRTLERGASYQLLALDEPLDRALRDFLLRRRRLP